MKQLIFPAGDKTVSMTKSRVYLYYGAVSDVMKGTKNDNLTFEYILLTVVPDHICTLYFLDCR